MFFYIVKRNLKKKKKKSATKCATSENMKVLKKKLLEASLMNYWNKK